MFKIKNLRTKLVLTGIYAAIIITMKLLNLPCVYIALFNFPCPGCGMTRAVTEALMLDFKEAFNHHMMFWTMPLFYIHFLYDFKLFKNVWDKVFLIFLACGFMVNYIFKIGVLLS